MSFLSDNCCEDECRKMMHGCQCECHECCCRPCPHPKDDCWCQPPHHHDHHCPHPCHEPPCHKSCAVVEHKPRVLESCLFACIRIANKCRIEKVCTEIIGISRKCGKLIVCFKVIIFYIDCCGCQQECCCIFRNCCDEVGCCPHEPCVEITCPPKHECCGCRVEVKTPIKVTWR